jgi:hypothetical protein
MRRRLHEASASDQSNKVGTTMMRTDSGSDAYLSAPYGRASQYEYSETSSSRSSQSRASTTEYGAAPQPQRRRPSKPAQKPKPKAPQQRPSAPADVEQQAQNILLVRGRERPQQQQTPGANTTIAPIFNNAAPQPIIINNNGAPAPAPSSPAPAPLPININVTTPQAPGGYNGPQGGYGPGPGGYPQPGGYQQQGPAPYYGNSSQFNAQDWAVVRRTIQSYDPGYDPNAAAYAQQQQQPQIQPIYYPQPAYDPNAYAYDAHAAAAAYGYQPGFDMQIQRIGGPAQGPAAAAEQPKKWPLKRIIGAVLLAGGLFHLGLGAWGLMTHGSMINAFGIAPTGSWVGLEGNLPTLLVGAAASLTGWVLAKKPKPKA